MKNLLLAVSALLMVSCVDSELIIPGEVVGGGDAGGGTVVPTVVLKDMVGVLPNGNHRIQFTPEAKISNWENNGTSNIRMGYTRTANRITGVQYSNAFANVNTTYNVTYDPNGNLESMESSALNHTLMFTFANNVYTVLSTVGSTTITHSIELQNNRVKQISLNEGTTNEQDIVLTYAANNVTGMSINGNPMFTATYDGYANPVGAQIGSEAIFTMIDALFVPDTFIEDHSFASAVQWAQGMSANNLLTAQSGIDGTMSNIAYVYTYDSENRPVQATQTLNDTALTSNLTYTYY
ncbi:MAG: hypothetical protein Q4F57_07995 [Weeksellaceae bacterium]|nr:hypothetical protein [Weeksellaceae bacterium]